MLFTATIISAAVGAAVGSFLGVIIDRQAAGNKQQAASIGGRSRCSHCRRQLAWWENIPLISFILLRGKCRACRSPIPYWLPLIEIAAALAGVWLAYQASQTITVINFITIIKVISAAAIAAALLWIFFSDLVKGAVPDWAVAIGAAGAIVEKFAKLPITLESFANFSAPAIATALFFWLLVLITRGRGMGAGDVTLAFFLGLWLGWPKIAVAVWLAFLLGAIVGLGLIAAKRKKFGQTVPFGPFLIIGSLLAQAWGWQIINVLF